LQDKLSDRLECVDLEKVRGDESYTPR